MSRSRTFTILALAGTMLLLGRIARADDPKPPTKEGLEFFEKNIRPVLADTCYRCHSQDAKDKHKLKGKLMLDSWAAIAKGGESGDPAVVPGNPDKSTLIQALRYKFTGDDDDKNMPPKKKDGTGGKLPDETIQKFEDWVKMGAPYPADGAKSQGPTAPGNEAHWAFELPREPAVPHLADAKDAARVQNPIDAFVLAKLEEKGLALNPPADRQTLIRRATLDLTGLPPTSAEVGQFLGDSSPDAFSKVVDRLLSSPRYGERWGRHWLDVARYSDTKGYVFEEDRHFPYAYTYRDWVINAFNQDLPYDQFLIQQIAADKLDLGNDHRPLAAMGFLTVGRRFLNATPDIIDDRIDVVCRGTMGLTVGCARCHDHKFDPITTKDYYGLYGVLDSSTEPHDLPLISDSEPSTPASIAFNTELKTREAAAEAYRSEHAAMMSRRDVQTQYRKLVKAVEEFVAQSPAAPARAMVLVDLPRPHDSPVLRRGNPNSPGDVVPRHFLPVAASGSALPLNDGSGRLQLARAIASPNNPLTARVIVNRVWLNHFGKGIVRTPSDFGTRSDPPSHRELLDWLALRFVDSSGEFGCGWSIKRLHRLMLMSAVYQQSSDDGNARGRQTDSDNLLLWHMNRQRLDFEATRDSLLAVAGTLDTTMGGRAVDITNAGCFRRTVYGSIERQNLPSLFRAFDFASPDASSPQRFTTTVPQQLLFFLNSPFVIGQVKALARRLDAEAPDPADRVRYLYRLLYGRPAGGAELSAGVEFVRAESASPSAGLSPWEKYLQVLISANEFVYVD